MKIFIIVVLILLFSVLMYLIYSSKITESTSHLGQVFIAREGQTFHIKNEPLQVTVSKLLQDSRCPKDVDCFWAGWVAIELSIVHNNQTHTVQVGNVSGKSVYLPTPYSPNSPSFKEGGVQLNDYQIELSKIEPEQGSSNNKIASSDYRFHLVVKKVSK